MPPPNEQHSDKTITWGCRQLTAPGLTDKILWRTRATPLVSEPSTAGYTLTASKTGHTRSGFGRLDAL